MSIPTRRTIPIWRWCAVLAAGAALSVAAGCGGGGTPEPITLRPDAFFKPSTLQKAENRRRTAIDQPEDLTYDAARIDLLNEPTPPPVEAGVVAIDPEAQRLIPSAQPATTSAPLPPLGTGVAMAVGRVAVEVNGQPIFSKRVLQPIEPDLAANAREQDADTFRRLAAKRIRDQVDFLIRTELEVAAAKRNLAPSEIQLAEAVTAQWRQRQITEAGGSIELARQRAQAEGTTFEEKTEDEYRANLVRVYYQKRIFPRVQVNADDMRRYYDRNVAKFTQQPQAQFRLIKVDIRKMGDRAMAEQKARNLLARIRGGEDFAAVARDYNDDVRLRSLGGDMGMIDKGAFVLSAVENAAWALSPGEVSDVVEEKGAFYIVKLEQKTEGRTRSFDEEDVQDEIRNTLRSQQFEVLRDRQREQLIQGAVVNPYPPKIEPLLEIVMQKYPYWAMKQ